MKSVLVFISLCTLATFASETYYDDLTPLWEAWKYRHQKLYSAEEEALRFAIFIDHHHKILKFNKENDTPKLAINKFADLTAVEFKDLYSGCAFSDPSPKELSKELTIIQDLPSAVDWRNKGAVTLVKDQGQCGSCWAFSGVAALESAYFINSGTLKSFSEQQLIDCDSQDDGCDGGIPYTGIMYAEKQRLPIMAVVKARWLILFLSVSAAAWASAGAAQDKQWKAGGAVGGQVVPKEQRRMVAASEAGTVTAADVADAAGTVYRLQFITMDPGALFLPVQLHADMVFYVHSGRGKVTYIQEGATGSSSLEVERGDVYNFNQGSILYIQSYPNATRERFRIYAIFTSNAISSDDPSHPTSEAYTGVSNLLKGFDVEILRRGFGVSPDVVEAIKSAESPAAIISYNPDQEKKERQSNWTEDIFEALWGIGDPLNKEKKKEKKQKKEKKSETFNFYSGKPDVQNCYGWSKTMTNNDLQNLKGSDIGMFMVNLTTGSMMGPHWNPKAAEIAIVTSGSGVVQTVCPSSPSSTGGDSGHHAGGRGDEEGERNHHEECKNSVFRVKEGDVFVVPRFHPMAQMSFNNGSFVFVGFSTHMGQNHPQFLAGKQSVLQVIGKDILAVSLGQKNSTAVEKLMSAQTGSTIMACISCAEELERKAEQEEQEGGQGRGGGGEEERRRKEEEERRQREEEEQRRREEQERKQREEEERARKEEKERKQREQEEQRRREEEEERRRREEEEGGGGDQPPREEEEGAGGRGGEDEPPEEEEEGDWGGDSAKNLKKRYRVLRKVAVFHSA